MQLQVRLMRTRGSNLDACPQPSPRGSGPQSQGRLCKGGAGAWMPGGRGTQGHQAGPPLTHAPRPQTSSQPGAQWGAGALQDRPDPLLIPPRRCHLGPPHRRRSRESWAGLRFHSWLPAAQGRDLGGQTQGGAEQACWSDPWDEVKCLEAAGCGPSLGLSSGVEG